MLRMLGMRPTNPTRNLANEGPQRIPPVAPNLRAKQGPANLFRATWGRPCAEPGSKKLGLVNKSTPQPFKGKPKGTPFKWLPFEKYPCLHWLQARPSALLPAAPKFLIREHSSDDSHWQFRVSVHGLPTMPPFHWLKNMFYFTLLVLKGTYHYVLEICLFFPRGLEQMEAPKPTRSN